ncbi:MAG: PKD domain-containing protein, partial [Methanoregula sp.]|uniref:PKD domain-containing protein n=1 Tax=Methanoregula sp. TaxID=2052170 RepID=UPI003D0C72A4
MVRVQGRFFWACLFLFVLVLVPAVSAIPPPPTVTGISPASGPTAGGTVVTITGTNFNYPPIAVNFGSNSATDVTINSDTQITATAPAGTGIVDVTVNTSTNYWTTPLSPADEYTYVAPRQNSILLIQDSLPWGSNANIEVLSASGISYQTITSGNVASTDLNQYAKVIIASDQTSATYANLAAVVPQINQYVVNGGMLEVHAADQGWNSGSWMSLLPGGVSHVVSDSDYNYIVDDNHPVVAGLSNSDFSGWNWVSHGYFTNLPEGTTVILDNADSNPTVIEYHIGAGTVLATLETIEWTKRNGYCQNGKILINTINYFVYGSALPVANFTANVTSGMAPLTVQFNDTSTGSPTAWNWSFGDGNYSAAQNPVYTYTAAGNYTVCLTATNAGGSNTTIQTDYIIVTGSPVPVPVTGPATISSPGRYVLQNDVVNDPYQSSWNGILITS